LREGRRRALFLVLLTIAAMVAGCSGGSDANAQKQEGKEEVEKAAEAPQGGIAVPADTAHEIRFEQAQSEARAGNVGIWGPTLDQQCLLADRGNGIGEGSIKCDLMAQESASPSASASADSSASAGPSGGSAVAPASEDDCPMSALSRATSPASITCRAGHTTT
jgi:hypothetical protein